MEKIIYEREHETILRRDPFLSKFARTDWSYTEFSVSRLIDWTRMGQEKKLKSKVAVKATRIFLYLHVVR